MGKQFEVTWERELAATPAQVWDAFTVHTEAYIWKVDYEPWAGGKERGLTGNGGTVTVWEPYSHFTTRANDGTNELDYRLEPRGERTYLRYTHHATVDEAEFDIQLASCQEHTLLYNHTLGQYVQHFPGQPVAYAVVDAPESSAHNGYTTVRDALGIPTDAAVGDRVHLTPQGLEPIDGVIDYVTDAFLGIRTANALYRIYGRDKWGWPVGVSVHQFDGGADDDIRQAWDKYLTDVFDSEAVA